MLFVHLSIKVVISLITDFPMAPFGISNRFFLQWTTTSYAAITLLFKLGGKIMRVVLPFLMMISSDSVVSRKGAEGAEGGGKRIRLTGYWAFALSTTGWLFLIEVVAADVVCWDETILTVWTMLVAFEVLLRGTGWLWVCRVGIIVCCAFDVICWCWLWKKFVQFRRWIFTPLSEEKWQWQPGQTFAGRFCILF